MPSYNRNFGLRLGEGVGFFARADTELLSSGQAPVYQNLDLYAPICRPPLRGLVGRCRVRFAHGPRCHDAPYGNVAVLDQESDNLLRPILTQPLVHGGTARRIRESLHLNEIAG